MKKFNSGIMALLLGVVIAIGSSAFKAHEKATFAMYTFQYNGPDLSEANVEEPANWDYVNSSTLCSATTERACRIRVDQAYVDNPGSTPTLKTGFLIDAQESETDVAYVAELEDPDGIISNSEH